MIVKLDTCYPIRLGCPFFRRRNRLIFSRGGGVFFYQLATFCCGPPSPIQPSGGLSVYQQNPNQTCSAGDERRCRYTHERYPARSCQRPPIRVSAGAFSTVASVAISSDLGVSGMGSADKTKKTDDQSVWDASSQSQLVERLQVGSFYRFGAWPCIEIR